MAQRRVLLSLFRRITASTVRDICQLSETLTPPQRKMVADNAVSIAQAHFAESAWFRAIYADDTPADFILLHS
jgi:diamine N-acetyltransferase